MPIIWYHSMGQLLTHIFSTFSPLSIDDRNTILATFTLRCSVLVYAIYLPASRKNDFGYEDYISLLLIIVQVTYS